MVGISDFMGSKELYRACQIWWTRGVSVPLPGASETVPCLVPYVDILNHSSSHGPVHYEVHDNMFQLVTTTAYKKGSQVFNNFGTRPNERYFLTYGFVLEDNPNDTVHIELGFEKDPLKAEKERLMKYYSLDKHHYLAKGEKPIDSRLLETLRILIMNELELYSFHETDRNAQRPISVRNELQLWNSLENMLLEKLSKFTTTIEEDLRLLQQDLERPLRLCVLYRMQQKQIMTQALTHLRQLRLEFFTSLPQGPFEISTAQKQHQQRLTQQPNMVVHPQYIKWMEEATRMHLKTPEGWINTQESQHVFTFPSKQTITNFSHPARSYVYDSKESAPIFCIQSGATSNR